MKVILITQARFGSTRLKGKVFIKLLGKTLLEIHLSRLKKSKLADKIVIATTMENEADEIIEIANKLEVESFRGDMDDVLDRFYHAAKLYNPDLVVRVTADCPLIDADLIDKIIAFTIQEQVDYCSNTLIECFPDGQDVEVFTFKALKDAWKNAKLHSEREHVTPFIRNNSDFFYKQPFRALAYIENIQLGDIRLTVDEAADVKVIQTLIENLGTDASMEAYVDFIQNTPSLKTLNKDFRRNEGYLKSLEND